MMSHSAEPSKRGRKSSQKEPGKKFQILSLLATFTQVFLTESVHAAMYTLKGSNWDEGVKSIQLSGGDKSCFQFTVGAVDDYKSN